MRARLRACVAERGGREWREVPGGAGHACVCARGRLLACVHVRACMCVCGCVRACIRMLACVHACICLRACVRASMCVRALACVCLRACVRAYVRACVRGRRVAGGGGCVSGVQLADDAVYGVCVCVCVLLVLHVGYTSLSLSVTPPRPLWSSWRHKLASPF